MLRRQSSHSQTTWDSGGGGAEGGVCGGDGGGGCIGGVGCTGGGGEGGAAGGCSGGADGGCTGGGMEGGEGGDGAPSGSAGAGGGARGGAISTGVGWKSKVKKNQTATVETTRTTWQLVGKPLRRPSGVCVALCALAFLRICCQANGASDPSVASIAAFVAPHTSSRSLSIAASSTLARARIWKAPCVTQLSAEETACSTSQHGV
eukprot:3579308-Prymnesium_polylepis.1